MYVNRCCISRRQKWDKEAEKIIKYEDLTIKIQLMWNVKTKEIAVIVRANRSNSESLRQYPEQHAMNARNQ